MKRIKIYSIYIFTILGVMTPAVSHAGLLFTEIAWMGDLDSANHEWIELTNTGTSTISIDNWKIIASDGTPSIDLSGTVASGESIVLERTSDESASGEAFQIYSGSLGNGGETLSLLDENDLLISKITSIDGWPGGDNTTKETANWDNGTWITAPATPGVYSGFKKETATSTTETATEKPQPIAFIVDAPYEYSIDAPEQVVVGQKFKIASRLSRGLSNLEYGNILVNFGDGTFYDSGKKIQDISHAYEHPGRYLITYEVRHDPWSEKILATNSRTIEAIKPIIQIETNNNQVRLSQETDFFINISNWTIHIGEDVLILPPLSFLEKNNFVIPIDKPEQEIRLYDERGGLWASTKPENEGAETLVTAKESKAFETQKTKTTPRVVKSEKKEDVIAESFPTQPLLAQVNQANQTTGDNPQGFPWWNLLLPVLILLGLGVLGYLYWSEFQQDEMDQPRLFDKN